MPIQESSGALQIGEWIADPTLDSISRGTETQKLEPRMMRLLLCLATHAGAVVSVDYLLTEVWAEVVVGPASVYQAVSQLRKILGDVGPQPTYITTVPRKGYRLIAAVQPATALVVQAPQAAQGLHIAQEFKAPVVLRPAPKRRLWSLTGALVGSALVAVALVAVYVSTDRAWFAQHIAGKRVTVAADLVNDKSIAVLPFVDMSESKDQEYFADGMAEELINHLSRSPGLKVIARTSSFQFKGKSEDVRAIAAALGVANLLDGSIRKVGQELRVTTELIRASDGVDLWSETYDRNIADIFKVQDEISEKVARSLNTTLAIYSQPIGKETDVEAYNLVLEGNFYKLRRTRSDVEKAVQLYQKAIDRRPNYALPYARLAGAYLTLEEVYGEPTAEDNPKIIAALDRALSLDPNLVWAYYTRAGFEGAILWDWAAAQADQERIRALEPGIYLLPIALGDMAMVSGRAGEAVRHYQRAVELNPLDAIALRALGVALCAADRLEECLQSRLKLQQLHPELRGVNAFVGEARLLLGQLAEALDAMQKEPDGGLGLAGVAAVDSAMGRRAESDAALKMFEEGHAADVYALAEVHAFRGDADAALDLLQRSLRMHDSNILFIKTDPLLRKLRPDRRFQSLVADLRLPA